jgi:hypothetical protein
LMVEKTARGVGVERRRKVGNPKVDIRVDDVYGTIASVTVNSAPYHEYLHLVRTRAGWKIANALWQWTVSAPVARSHASGPEQVGVGGAAMS